jgi:hypothetical protein
MQSDRGNRLRKAWAEKGNPPCDHATLDKEYYLGADTEDLICTTCGETWWRNDPTRPGTAHYPNTKKSD